MSGDELRNRIAEVLMQQWPNTIFRRDAAQVTADAILALPEMQAMLAEDAEVERLRDEMSTMHRTVVHDCCVQVQSERRLADQLADALRWQADPFQTETLGMTHRALDAYEEARRER